jgi:hypothetical protein
MLAEDTSRDKCSFPDSNITRFISISDLFTDSHSYICYKATASPHFILRVIANIHSDSHQSTIPSGNVNCTADLELRVISRLSVSDDCQMSLITFPLKWSLISRGSVWTRLLLLRFLMLFDVRERSRRIFRLLGRAVAQAVSRWLPTTEARVQTRVWSCGIL